MTTYITSDGDCWDAIAKKMYGNELQADVLIAANLQHIGTFMFDSGTHINVPELTKQQQQPSVPWRN